MPPKPRVVADDVHGSKADAHKDKNGPNGSGAPGSGVHERQHAATNGKARRTAAASNASATAAAAAAVAAAAAATVVQTDPNPTLQWSEFDRGVLHAYQRAYKIDSPGAFSNEFSRWILSQPGSVGLHSPTSLRHKETRRQSKAQLANATRKHFNGLGVQENDIVVDFLHKVQTREVVRLRRPRRHGSNSRELAG
ncbi:hypothetical protein F503_05040 [Ophiostoma piceae UAMH 11346]|uniref:Histone deacetylase complex subunit SAP30 Sin3 binding domain-containing protein n=1 Tax=Ophiostoma piceae (strain UAMH 11346) TaxID=1262450 RepID=S3D8Y5_OPHP1|nr:hypothetical protein F503_05040 [Ophiostoma piceae UAMH 11346]